ncbi:MAG: diacylglycerol kinase family protein [Bacteroidales bacterium]|nr:diacylglycerol kinase family protein [Bacteroidales bacterium]
MDKIKYQLRTFVFAFRGIVAFFRLESKAVIHLVAAILAIAMSWILEISAMEWLLVILAIILVFTAELFNTIAEEMADLIQPEKDKKVAYIKDMGAGAVLLTAIGALIVGLVIFLPKIVDLF